MEIQEPQLLRAKRPRKRPPNIIMKSTFCALLLTIYTVYRFTYHLPGTTGIIDACHTFTITLNRGLVMEAGPAFEGNSNQLTVFGKAFIGLGQVLMDLWIAIMAGIWLFKTSNLRVMAGIGLFYLIRGTIFLNVMKFPYPANLAWRSPGFFSFTVPYDHTRDFFFSGHCGGLSVVVSEMFTLGLIKTGVFSMLALIYMATMLMITEVHYSIDIIAGILFGIWFFRFAAKYTIFFDRLSSLPLVGWRKVVACVGPEDDIEIETNGSQGGQQTQPNVDQNEKQKARSEEFLANEGGKSQVLQEYHTED